MAIREPMLTDEQWKKIEPLLPELPQRGRRGRPWADNRAVLEGIIWILKTGARWKDLPTEFPSPSTCWRRLRLWEEQGVWEDIWRTFLGELQKKDWKLWEEVFADASFFPAKKGATPSERRSWAKAQSAWWWLTAGVFHWERGSILQARLRSSPSKPRSPQSGRKTLEKRRRSNE